MTDFENPDSFYYAHIAEGHRRGQAHSTGPEADHWALEAERFEDLASLAAIDPVEARRRYRPTVAYQPEA